MAVTAHTGPAGVPPYGVFGGVIRPVPRPRGPTEANDRNRQIYHFNDTVTKRLMQNPAITSEWIAVHDESSRRAGSDNRQRLLRTIERRFLGQTFHDGEAVAVRSYVRTRC